jgi:hypothetical protein
LFLPLGPGLFLTLAKVTPFNGLPPCGRDRVVATLRGTSTFDRPRVHSARPMAMHRLEITRNPVLIFLRE